MTQINRCEQLYLRAVATLPNLEIHLGHPAYVLKNAPTFFKKIRAGVLRDSQFPGELADTNGIFRKPASW